MGFFNAFLPTSILQLKTITVNLLLVSIYKTWKK